MMNRFIGGNAVYSMHAHAINSIVMEIQMLPNGITRIHSKIHNDKRGNVDENMFTML